MTWLKIGCMGTVLLAVGCLVSNDCLFAAETTIPRTVQLTIDYGDGVQKIFTHLSWSEDMTVLGVLEMARRHPRGIEFHHRGQGSTALLLQIDDLKNKGGRGHNWIYWVNKNLGKQSFAVEKISISDHVLWKFGEYE